MNLDNIITVEKEEDMLEKIQSDGFKTIINMCNKGEHGQKMSPEEEAEKAGEYGSGFSVVASEIRRLADQTAVATYDIAHMVREVQSAISDAVTGIDKFASETHESVKNVHLISENLSGVIDMVEVIKPQVEGLSEGIEAQTQGANQISDAIGQLNETAQHTAETLSQTSTAISHLHNAALGLQESTALFKVEKDY